ncbi:MAG TPA: YbaK/EbsC family protein [Rhodobacteraceae bacterium]|nr:YbaK/EbsC family protein [Paracoccaceae bacterium]
MSRGTDRVRAAAAAAGLEIRIRRMGESTRTAEEAARQCGCDLAQIIKSLVFQGKGSGQLFLFLIPGDRRLDMDKAALVAGEEVSRADPRRVRERTGFAIGGVSPIGHLEPPLIFADKSLLDHAHVWAAAGAHDAVFRATPAALIKAAGAGMADLA